MAYSVKWIEKNLGITRKSLQYYEKEELMHNIGSRNPLNNYREYSEEDIEKIWGIKLLIGIGFSAKEIREIMNNPNFDFYSSISKKVEELKKKKDESCQYYEFARTIKLTGRIPTTNEIGSIKYDSFMEYVRENWNVFSNQKAAACVEMIDLTLNKTSDEITLEDFAGFDKLLDMIGDNGIMYLSNISAYCRIIAEMCFMDFTSESVQTTVRLLYEYFCEYSAELGFDRKPTPQDFAQNFISYFLDGDIAVLHERNYGKEGCIFISKAILFFGGCEKNRA